MSRLTADKELQKQGYRNVSRRTSTGQEPFVWCVIDRGQASSGGFQVLNPALMASQNKEETETIATTLYTEAFDPPPLENEFPMNLISDRWWDREARNTDLNAEIRRAFSDAIMLKPDICNPNDIETLLPRFCNNPSTRRLLQLLEQSPSHLRNDIFEGITRTCNVDEILDESLALFDETHRENFLLQAVALLEVFHEFAWPALKRLIRLRRCETELFVRLIASCDGIPEENRAESLRDLAVSPHVEVRSAVLDHLSELDQGNARLVLEILSQDKDDDIREGAMEYLGELV